MYFPKMSDVTTNPDDLVTLLVEDRKIVCSKKSLKQNSKYFDAMFSWNYKETNANIITLKGIDAETMELLVRILVDRLNFDKIPDMLKLLMLCDMFLFDQIKEDLSKEIIKTLTLNNCLHLWMKLRTTSVTSLVWKAKSISLTNFEYQRVHGFINTLKLNDLVTYLGHKNLQCEREIYVFHSVLEWIYSNYKCVDEVPLDEILASVINFKNISVSELNEIMCHKEILKYPNIVKTLEYIINFKCGGNVLIANKYSDLARHWLNVRGRYLPNYLCVLTIKHKFEIFYHGSYKESFMKKISAVPSNIQNLAGFEILVHKRSIYIIGGEFTIGTGAWNEKFYKFDLEDQKLIDTKYNSSIKRRHFKSCLIGELLYIVGGTGPYRIKENNMMYFDFRTEQWISTKIELPCEYLSSKCCNFNEQLFILDCDGKCGWFFIHEKMEWKRVMIAESVEIEEHSKLSIFAYRGSLFLKGNKLVELELVIDTLTPKLVHVFENVPSGSLVETVSCYNIVYSSYVDELDSDVVRLEWLDLNDLTTTMHFKKIGLYYECNNNKNRRDFYLSEYYGANLIHNAKSRTKMFMFHHHKLIESQDLLIDRNI